MNLNTVAPLAPTETHEAQILKQWAAEHFAISIGLLSECPYHGQPFRSRGSAPTGSKPRAANIVDLRHPAVQAFHGNTRELLAAAKRVAGEYLDVCAHCAASDDEEDFD